MRYLAVGLLVRIFNWKQESFSFIYFRYIYNQTTRTPPPSWGFEISVQASFRSRYSRLLGNFMVMPRGCAPLNFHSSWVDYLPANHHHQKIWLDNNNILKINGFAPCCVEKLVVQRRRTRTIQGTTHSEMADLIRLWNPLMGRTARMP